MLDERTSYGLFKIGQQKWMKRLYGGEVSFSCPKAFIFQAKHGGNDEQGDLDEAVFARLKVGDPRINEMKDFLGKDLEIINDGCYVKLRRKSSCFIPIFCIYTIMLSDFESQVKKVGDNYVRIDISQKIWDGFLGSSGCQNVLSPDFRTMGIFFQPRPFFEHLESALADNGYPFKRNKIDYTLEAAEEFFIEPTVDRCELFYKRPKYEYQHEERIVLMSDKVDTVFDRVNIRIEPLSTKDQHFIDSAFYLTAHVKTRRQK